VCSRCAATTALSLIVNYTPERKVDYTPERIVDYTPERIVTSERIVNYTLRMALYAQSV
jgi:hypothetical protein